MQQQQTTVLNKTEKETSEFIELLRPLKNEEKATVKGIIIGINMTKENKT